MFYYENAQVKNKIITINKFSANTISLQATEFSAEIHGLGSDTENFHTDSMSIGDLNPSQIKSL